MRLTRKNNRKHHKHSNQSKKKYGGRIIKNCDTGVKKDITTDTDGCFYAGNKYIHQLNDYNIYGVSCWRDREWTGTCLR